MKVKSFTQWLWNMIDMIGVFISGLVVGAVAIVLWVQWPDIKRSYRKIMGLRSRNRLMAGVPKRVTPVDTWYDLMHGGHEGSVLGRECRVYRYNGKTCFFRHVHDDQYVVLEFADSDFDDEAYHSITLTRTFYEKPNGFKEVRLIKTRDGEFESREYPIKLERILDVY